jgi:hypothetical protein
MALRKIHNKNRQADATSTVPKLLQHEEIAETMEITESPITDIRHQPNNFADSSTTYQTTGANAKSHRHG